MMDSDKYFMEKALLEAQKSIESGNFPVGAVLAIDGNLVGAAHNELKSSNNWISHAELLLLFQNSEHIRKSYDSGFSHDSLYTTLEPCLMCLGAILIHRIMRVVVACPDPLGGATHLDPKSIQDWYVQKWPNITTGLLQEKSYDILISYIRQQKTEPWQAMQNLIEQMHRSWGH